MIYEAHLKADCMQWNLITQTTSASFKHSNITYQCSVTRLSTTSRRTVRIYLPLAP